MLCAGATFRSSDRRFETHLWIIVSDPQQYPNCRVLIVNVTTWRNGKDSACILEAGEHRSLGRKSCIYYRESKLVPRARLEQGFQNNVLIADERVDPGVLKRIRDGARTSKFIPLAHRQLLIDQGLIEPQIPF